MKGGPLGLFEPVPQWWNRFAGDQGHTWLGHYLVARHAQVWGAIDPSVTLYVGFAIFLFYLGREAVQWKAGSRNMTDMLLDWIFVAIGFVDAVRWTAGAP